MLQCPELDTFGPVLPRPVDPPAQTQNLGANIDTILQNASIPDARRLGRGATAKQRFAAPHSKEGTTRLRTRQEGHQGVPTKYLSEFLTTLAKMARRTPGVFSS